jgi:hypothetical protein
LTTFFPELKATAKKRLSADGIEALVARAVSSEASICNDFVF